MKKSQIKAKAIYTLIPIICFIYIFYYEKVLYYKPIANYTIIFDDLYEYIAIPLFYFFITTIITFSIFDLFNIRLSKTLNKVFAFILGFVLFIYIILILLKKMGLNSIPTISFLSIYSIVFSALGCFFALASYKNKSSQRNE